MTMLASRRRSLVPAADSIANATDISFAHLSASTQHEFQALPLLNNNNNNSSSNPTSKKRNSEPSFVESTTPGHISSRSTASTLPPIETGTRQHRGSNAGIGSPNLRFKQMLAPTAYQQVNQIGVTPGDDQQHMYVDNLTKEEEEQAQKVAAATMSVADYSYKGLDDIQSVHSAGSVVDDSLKDSQHTLDMICQAAMDAVIIISETGSIKSVNQEALRLFGYNLWEIAGHNVKMLMPKKYSTMHDHYLDRYRKTKVKRIIGQQRTNIHGLRKDGSMYPLKLKVSEIADRNGVVYLAALKNVGVEEEFVRIKSMVAQMLPTGYHERLFQDDGLSGNIGKLIADECKNASVIAIGIDGFYDLVNQSTQPEEVLHFLNEMLTLFDESCMKNGLEQIKTFGDTYMAGSGVTSTIYDAPVRVMETAMDLLIRIDGLRQSLSTMPEFTNLLPYINVKIGISTGRVLSGVTKSHRFGFDVWGAAVPMAQSLKDEAPVNGIKVCKHTFEFTKHRYGFQKEEMKMYKNHPLYPQVLVLTTSTVVNKKEPCVTKTPDGELIVEAYMYKENLK